MLFSPGFNFDFLSHNKVIGGKSMSDITYLVSSGTLYFNSVSQSLWN